MSLEYEPHISPKKKDPDRIRPKSNRAIEGNVKLDGGTVGRDDRILTMLQKVPDEQVQCPFCFTKQSIRATKMFNSSGEMLKSVRCAECKAIMRAETMRWTVSPYLLGQRVGEYFMWWKKVDHDKWMELLKKNYGRTKDFWDGYAKTNERFAARKIVEKAQEDYARDTGQPLTS